MQTVSSTLHCNTIKSHFAAKFNQILNHLSFTTSSLSCFMSLHHCLTFQMSLFFFSIHSGLSFLTNPVIWIPTHRHLSQPSHSPGVCFALFPEGIPLIEGHLHCNLTALLLWFLFCIPLFIHLLILPPFSFCFGTAAPISHYSLIYSLLSSIYHYHAL